MLSNEENKDIPWGDRIVTITCKRCGATIDVNNFEAQNGYRCPSCGQWVNTKTWNNES